MDINDKILLTVGTNEVEIVEFYMKDGDQTLWFGINAAKVREISRFPKYNEFNGDSPYIMGIFKFRDEVVPLIPLRKILGLKEPEYSQEEKEKRNSQDKTKVIVAEFNGSKFGFVVDDLNRILRFSWKDIESPTSISKIISLDLIVGIIKNEHMIQLLDFEKIVSIIDPELSISTKNVKLDDIKRDLNVWIADDSKVVRDLVLGVFKGSKFNLTEFNDGKELSDALISADPSNIDLIITDIEMPRLDGLSLTKSIKSNEKTKEIPVMIFSSLVTDELRKKANSVGADYTISKSEIDNLIAFAKEAIENRNYSKDSNDSDEN